MRGKTAVVADGSGSGIVLGGDELHLLILQAKIVNRFLDQIEVLVVLAPGFQVTHSYEKNFSIRVTVAGGLQPGVVGMAVDLFFQRVEDAQPRISKSWT
jgi:hypothetical protein